MKAYQDLIRHVLTNGCEKEGRNGGTISAFGAEMKFNLQDGFPIVTTKAIFFGKMLDELLAFCRGHIYLDEFGSARSFWAPFADEHGCLGPIYGYQWRRGKWATGDNEGGHKVVEIDQLKQVIENIIAHPYSRRHIVTSWNPGQNDEMGLPPCHSFFQFNVRPAISFINDERQIATTRVYLNALKNLMGEEEFMAFYDGCAGPGGQLSALAIAEGVRERGLPDKFLSCKMYQRSADVFLGVPYNISSYATLTHMVAQVTNCLPGTLYHSLGDSHLYDEHINQALDILDRDPHPLPTLRLDRSVKDIDEFESTHFHLENYTSEPFMPAPLIA
jgi:thymidylate synthase